MNYAFSYDKPLDKGARTLLSLGGYYNNSSNDVVQTTSAISTRQTTPG
jgi:hypothetical protein